MSVEDEDELRAGLNGAEAAIAWAYAQFGGDLEAIEVLEADAARDLEEVVEAVVDRDEKTKRRLVERWRRRDRRSASPEARVDRLEKGEVEQFAEAMSPRWRRALESLFDGERAAPWSRASVRTRRAVARIALSPLSDRAIVERPRLRSRAGFSLESLVEMEPVERDAFIRRLGVFQLAELAREQDRRHLARLRRTLGSEDRDWFDECIARERPIDRAERGRIRELFLAVSRQEPDLLGRLLHLGIYTIAAAAGERFAARLQRVAARLPGALSILLNHYHLLDVDAGLPPLGSAFRRALDVYVERLDAHRRKDSSYFGPGDDR